MEGKRGTERENSRVTGGGDGVGVFSWELFSHAGSSAALRQMENRKVEQGEIELSQAFYFSGLLTAVCVCVSVCMCVCVCVSVCVFPWSVRSSSLAVLTLSGTDSCTTKEVSVLNHTKIVSSPRCVCVCLCVLE